ncbi:hypothetical protein [Furfurilactobacillus milii]|uniref:DUF1453 family protein n=1 Tax=Furfurilactobacillus rossiae TaxID=231049 RepID=A0A7C9N4Y3_9LACO|nr:hypothetical protein [Furfurilactobacillus milii]MYV05909.1 hypothetical protein [Furfurilactobacillus milii]
MALFVLYAVLKRQLSPHRIQLNLTFYLFLILFGAASVSDAITHNYLIVTADAGLFVLGSLISAVLFGYLRTLSYRLWIDKTGTVMRQGNWETIVLWIVGLFIHSLASLSWHGSNATILLYLGITLLVQRGLVWIRAKRQYPEAMANTVTLNENRHVEREQRRQRRREERITRHNNA